MARSAESCPTLLPMTVLDRPQVASAPRQAVARATRRNAQELRCIVCRKPFDFAAGEVAVILKHIAYGYDFAHDGRCVAHARQWLFVEPGYDRPAFSTDGQRTRVVRTASAEGWSAILPKSREEAEAGEPVSEEPLQCWALVEYRNGTRRLEGIIRAAAWLNEPGGAEFPEARIGRRATLGYVRAAEG
jgi:hypothetical protein